MAEDQATPSAAAEAERSEIVREEAETGFALAVLLTGTGALVTFAMPHVGGIVDAIGIVCLVGGGAGAAAALRAWRPWARPRGATSDPNRQRP